jgi:uncharacterized membrane protein YhaH (DUF805 family)
MFTDLQNLFNLTQSAAKDALIAGWLVMLAMTAIVTRLSLKAIVSVIVVGMIAIAVANNYAFIKQSGDNTIKEIKKGSTTGLPAPHRTATDPARVVLDRAV